MAGMMPASQLAQMIRGAKPLVPAAHMVMGATDQPQPSPEPEKRVPGVYPVGNGVVEVVGVDGRIQPVEEDRLYSEPEVAQEARRMILGDQLEYLPEPELPSQRQMGMLRRAGVMERDPASGEEMLMANVPGGGKQAFPIEFDKSGRVRLGQQQGQGGGWMSQLAALIRGR